MAHSVRHRYFCFSRSTAAICFNLAEDMYPGLIVLGAIPFQVNLRLFASRILHARQDQRKTSARSGFAGYVDRIALLGACRAKTKLRQRVLRRLCNGL